jgi:hypothetical protein
MTSLMPRTPSSSFCRAVLRACSVSYLDGPLRGGAAFVLSEGWELDVLAGLEGRDGDAKRSSVSEESDRASLPMSGVDMAVVVLGSEREKGEVNIDVGKRVLPTTSKGQLSIYITGDGKTSLRRNNLTPINSRAPATCQPPALLEQKTW